MLKGIMATKTWVYTMFETDEATVTKLRALECNKHTCAKEICPETGKEHLQGAITFKRSYRLAALKKLFPRAHWEPAKAIDAANYCLKADSETLIHTNSGAQGARNDLHAVKAAIEAGAKLEDLAEDHFPTMVKYGRGVRETMMLLEKKKFKHHRFETKVTVLWGEPGTGKSRRAREMDPDLFMVPDIENGKLWFDGYGGETTILFEEYYGQLPLSTLLRITDIYPMTVPTKGGFVTRKWSQVIFTSNMPPAGWYPLHNFDALKRRIETVTEVTGGNTKLRSQPRITEAE